MKGTNSHLAGEPAQTAEADDDELEWISKSQLKRDSKALQDLGKKLSEYNAEQLGRVPLEPNLLEAIQLAQKLGNKRGALKRQFQFIGKLLRGIDAEPIIEAVEAIEAAQANSVQHFKSLERWRDRILLDGDSAINDYCGEHPSADRQKIRQLYRNHVQASEDKKTRFARMLFKELRETQ